jgi:hypothetical protein
MRLSVALRIIWHRTLRAIWHRHDLEADDNIWLCLLTREIDRWNLVNSQEALKHANTRTRSQA